MTVRILHVIDRVDCYGTSRQLSLLVQGLPRGQFSNRICALEVSPVLPEELSAAQVSFGAVASRGLTDPLWPARLWRLVREFRPQIIHGWGGRANVVAALATLAQRKAALVLSRRCVTSRSNIGGALRRRAILRKAHRIVVNSAAIWDECAAWGAPKEKLTLIPNGVAPPSTPALSRRQLLAELGLPRDCRLVCTAGRLDWYAGIKDAIWAADLLKVIREDVHLLVCGNGNQHDRLVQFRDQVRIQDKVHFLGLRTDLRWIVAHCDVFWATGCRGGQPNAILEAMAAAVPVVATQVPGHTELLQPNVTGFLISPGDRAALARFTNRLLDNVEMARRMGEAAQSYAVTEFSASKMVARYAHLYREGL